MGMIGDLNGGVCSSKLTDVVSYSVLAPINQYFGGRPNIVPVAEPSPFSSTEVYYSLIYCATNMCHKCPLKPHLEAFTSNNILRVPSAHRKDAVLATKLSKPPTLTHSADVGCIRSISAKLTKSSQ